LRVCNLAVFYTDAALIARRAADAAAAAAALAAPAPGAQQQPPLQAPRASVAVGGGPAPIASTRINSRAPVGASKAPPLSRTQFDIADDDDDDDGAGPMSIDGDDDDDDDDALLLLSIKCKLSKLARSHMSSDKRNCSCTPLIMTIKQKSSKRPRRCVQPSSINA
jgi:hypothetical protein